MPFTQAIEKIIRQRTSVRTYRKGAIDPGKETMLKNFLASEPTGPFKSKTRFQLITADPEDENALKGLGTYGVIKEPAGFVVGALDESEPKSLEDFGYVLEHIILAGTDLGLGTCWLGGSFRKSRFAAIMNLTGREIVPAVTPVGSPAEKRSLRDSLIRRGAGSDRRMPWEKLFFNAHFETPLSRNIAGTYALPLDMLRLAPSASNKQPWRIVKEAEENIFHFFLTRTPGYKRDDKKYFRMADLQRVDMGIAMCHFELTAKEQDLSGRWELRDPGLTPVPEHTEYSVTWTGE